jgi:hypothetical protein
MKNRTRRRLGAWARTPLMVSSGIAGIFGLISAVLIGIYGSNVRTWVLVGVFALIGAIAAVRIALVRDVAAEPEFFSSITFDHMTDELYDEVLTQIARGDSATPQFAAIAPSPDELKIVLDQLASNRVSYISGSPGDGKSTLAYQAAFNLYPEGYSAYELVPSAANGFSREYLRDKLLAQADALPGEFRLIIVDDSHLLERAEDVKEVLLTSIEDWDTYLIWIATDYLEPSTDRRFGDVSVHISYDRLAAKQATFFRDSIEDGRLSSSLAMLDEAADMSAGGTIKTAWQYSFVAWGGSARLAASLAALTDLEMFVIFEVSARSVVTGALEVPMPEIQSTLVDTSVGWVRDDVSNSSYRKILEDLSHRSAQRDQFLRINSSGASGTEVACLHYAFAREVVRQGMNRTAIAADLIGATGSIVSRLRKDHARFLAVLLRDIGQYLNIFVNRSGDYVTQYIYSPAEGLLTTAAEALGVLVQAREDLALQELIDGLDAERITDRINRGSGVEIAAIANVLRYTRPVPYLHDNLLDGLEIAKLAIASCDGSIKFQGVADLIRELGTRRNEMIDHLDTNKLAATANTANTTQFPGIADLIRELGTRRNEMIDHLDTNKLAATANTANTTQFPGIAGLIRELGTRRNEMIDHLDTNKLAATANCAQPSELVYITELLRELGKRRNDVIENLDLDALGVTIGRADPRDFGSAALFLQALDLRSNGLISRIDTDTLIRKANNARAAELKHVGDLLWTLGAGRRAAFDEKILPHLDLGKLGSTISHASISELGPAASLISRFGRRRLEVTRRINLTRISREVMNARPSEFTSIAIFLRELGVRKDEFVAALDIFHLAHSASNARPRDYASVAFFMREVGPTRDEFVAALKVSQLALSASGARPGEFNSVAEFLLLLDERSAEFVSSLDVRKLAMTASHAQSRDLRSVALLIRLLAERNDEFIDTLDLDRLATAVAHAPTRDSRGVADLRSALGQRRDEFANACTEAKRERGARGD